MTLLVPLCFPTTPLPVTCFLKLLSLNEPVGNVNVELKMLSIFTRKIMQMYVARILRLRMQVIYERTQGSIGLPRYYGR